MDISKARSLIIAADLVLLASLFLFLIIAPVARYPLSSDESWQIGQIVFPVFIGYLATATAFLTSQTPALSELGPDRNPTDFLLIVIGPIAVFTLALVATFVVFGLSNAPSAHAGTGMTLATLTKIVSGILALLTATTSVVVTKLFGEAR